MREERRTSQFSNRIANRSTCFPISEGRHVSPLRRNAKGALQTAQKRQRERCRKCDASLDQNAGIDCLSLPPQKLTGPARSNQSRSDQAGREEGDRRLGGCPCDEGHGRREEKDRSSLRRESSVFLMLFSSSLERAKKKKSGLRSKTETETKKKLFPLCCSPLLPPPLPREGGVLGLFLFLSPVAAGSFLRGKRRSLSLAGGSSLTRSKLLPPRRRPRRPLPPPSPL